VAKKDYTAEIEIGDVTVEVRFVSQKERERINDEATPRGAERADRTKLANGLADAQIVGWHNLTPLDALGWGYLDFEDLPVGDDGCVPYSPQIAQLLFRECQYSKFAQPIEQTTLNMMEAIAREKKLAATRSAA
jgi:hypothetical protein